MQSRSSKHQEHSGLAVSSTATSPAPPQFAVQPEAQPSEAHVPEPMQALESEDTEMVSELNSDGKDEATGKLVDVEVVNKRAKCRYCPKSKLGLGDYACDSGKNGTSGMISHIRKYCKYYPPNQDKTQKIITGDRSQSNKMVARGFLQSDVMDACVEMIVIDELPFSFVEKKGFKKFCSVACPMFEVPSRRKTVRQFLKMYDAQKQQLKNDLSAHRINLTTDTWTSVQNTNYMVLTAHFIDCDWKIHKRVLNFCVIPNHQGNTIGDLIESCLLQWGIEKVLTITVDNASANKVAIDWVRYKMNKWNNSQAVLGGKYLHMRCCAHITNLIVSSGLRKLQKFVMAIRNAVRYVRSSPQRLDYFKTSIEKEKLTCKGLVCMDVPTRWNSTYMMLDAALKFKKAFTRMAEDLNSPFMAYFKEADEVVDEDGVVQTNSRQCRVGPPTDVDWDNATVFVRFLKVFYEVTLKVSASLHPTIHKTFHAVISMEKEIDKLFVAPEFATGSDAEKVLTDMAGAMRTKYNKYFVKYQDLNMLVLIALVLDPRFKLRHITHLFKKENFDEDDVQIKTREVKSVLMALYDEYVPKVDGGIHMRQNSSTENIGSASGSNNIGESVGDDFLDDLIREVEESDETVVSHEVDSYLTDPLAFVSKDVFFDILMWWKLNGPKYPVLAAIAKDVLSIQPSTVASESCFSTGGRVIDAFRSSLTPRSVEALICMQNWLKGDEISSLEDTPSIEEFEFYETIESEYANDGDT
ncbi:unnamed protein product [Prunus armeniaca]